MKPPQSSSVLARFARVFLWAWWRDAYRAQVRYLDLIVVAYFAIVAVTFLCLASCGVIDTLDGHIDDQGNCCAAGTPARVRECLIRLAPEGPAQCWQAQCSSPIGEVRALETEEGEILEWCEWE